MSMNEHEFYKRSFFDKISNHIKSIIFLTFIFTLIAFIYLLFAPKVYKTNATLEIMPKSDLLSVNGLDQKQESEYKRHFITQMDFLQSRYLVSKVVTSLHMNILYYENGGLKPYKILQKNPPFFIRNLSIKDDDFYEKIFHVELVDEDHYALRLVSKKSLGSMILGSKKTKPLIYQFSKPVYSEFMDFTITRNKFSSKKDFYFKVEHERDQVNLALKNIEIVENSMNSSIIKIIFNGYSPKGSQKFVNTLLDKYMEVYSGDKASRAQKHLKFLDLELNKEKKKLDELEDRLQKYIEDNGVSGISMQTKNLINAIYGHENQLEKLAIKHQNIETILAVYTKSYDYKDILARISQLGNVNLIKFVDAIQKEENQYKKLRKKYKKIHPNVKQIERSIAQKSITLEKSLKQILANLDSKSKKLKKYLVVHKNNLTTVPKKEIGYTRLKREHGVLEKNYLLLLDKKRQVSLSQRIKGDFNYRVLDFAFLPKYHSKPRKKIILILGFILGLIFGLLYALIYEYFAKKIIVSSEVEELTGLPYLGTIPYIKNKKLYNDLFVAKEPESIASQLMWSLRDRVDGFNLGKSSQVIAVTSMVKGEGKTTIAANLAICLGMGDKRAVVLSLDLRLPEIHAKFGIDNSVGLTSVLFGDKKLSEVIYRSSQFKNLYVIPSGPKISNPMKIINSDSVDKMLSELKKVYDYIVIDLPPAGVAAEAIFLMKKADLIISVLKSNYSEKSFVTYMESISDKNNIENLGFVLNGVSKKYIKIIARKENKKYIDHNKKYAV